jgi:hypothetical protein
MQALKTWIYTAALRGKKGEMDALSSLDSPSKDRLLPHLVLPSIGARDLEKRRALSREEFSLLQLGRLQASWSTRPCLVDFRALRFDAKDVANDAAQIGEFLKLSREFRCGIIPVIDRDTDTYRLGSIAEHVRHANCGVAIRVSLSDLRMGLDGMLETLRNSLGLQRRGCIIVLDLGEATISVPEIFARFISDWVAKIDLYGPWRKIIVEASNYPRKNPARPNNVDMPARRELLAWMHAVDRDRTILERAIFGDFGADHGHIEFKSGGRTVKHLRYATPETWIVSRGGKATEEHDGTIHTVARRIVESGQFVGERYSAGDEFIALCAEREATGNGTTWRWANMVHHLTFTAQHTASIAGHSYEVPTRTPRGRQMRLLDTK